MGSINILVVDDEIRMRKLVKDFLVKRGYGVLEAENGEQAVEIFFENRDIHLVILDVMMPLMDGYQAAAAIREYSQVPIVMLTARDSERDELRGFDVGADEYITKPFSPGILVARVEALLRRSGGGRRELVESGGIVLDKTAHEVKIDGQLLELSFKEFELLSYFMENAGIALSRERILNGVWNYDYFGDARTIDTHVKKLRSKLGEKGDYIHTIWGMGYKFEVSK
ncbi:MAG: response regulator transcription factor [Lachnospiraceae bacterium]|jgi:DNA-binding response OmpR family regulator|nr:response regulator transcription factor [Lachnospiraceae bacterium]